MSQKLTPAQRNYSVTERECLAVVMAVKKFRAYIELMPFTVITDHSSLKWLMSNKELSGRLARWSLLLQSYKFDIEHRQGSKNIVPDTLSRYNMDAICSEVTQLIDLESPAFLSSEYVELLNEIRENNEQLPDLQIRDKYIYKRTLHYDGEEISEDFSWKLWVPAELSGDLIAKAHNPPAASHGGFHKTLKRLKEYFFWPNMTVQVREFVRKCEICKETKPSNKVLRPPMGEEMVEIVRPFQKVYIDFLGPYVRSKSGNCFIFIVLDHVTKFVLLKAMAKANNKNVIRFLVSEVFYKFGVPEVIVSDNGKQFVSKEFSEMAETFGVRHMKTAIYSPQANASERVNQSILAAIRSYLKSDQRDWDNHLSEIEGALRSSVHSSIGMTPYFALFGTNMITHGSVYELARRLNLLEDAEVNFLPKDAKNALIRDKIRANLAKSYALRAKTYNKRARKIKFKPGQEVYRRNFTLSDASKLYNAKMGKKFLKCRIVRPVGNCYYELEDLQGKTIGVYHAKDIKQ